MGINHYDATIRDLLQELVTLGKLGQQTEAAKLAQQVLDRGYGTLTASERTQYNALIVPALERFERDHE